jgi:hypothetical protein
MHEWCQPGFPSHEQLQTARARAFHLTTGVKWIDHFTLNHGCCNVTLFLYYMHHLASRSTSVELERNPFLDHRDPAAPPANMSNYPMTERGSTTLPKTQFVDTDRGHAPGYQRLDGDHLAPNTPNQAKNSPTRPDLSRDSSFLHEATHYDYTKGPEHFRVARGDMPDNRVGDVDFDAVNEGL